MSLNDIINSTISTSGPSPTFPGFGIPLVAAYHTHGGSRRVMGPYTGVAGMVTDGFTTTEPAYLAVAKIFAQKIAPKSVLVGRRALPPSQVITLTPISTVTGTVYTLVIGASNAIGGTTVTYTVPGAATLTIVCTGLAAAMAAAATAYGFTTDHSSNTHITCSTTAAGAMVEYNVQVPASILRITDSTTDPGIATDLTAIRAESKLWYGLVLDNNSKNEVLAAAAWVETDNTLNLFVSSSDSDVADANVTTDVLSTCKANGYFRTAVMFNQYSNLSYGAAAWVGFGFPKAPGSATWDSMQLSSVQADSDYLVPEASVLAVKAKNGTTFTTIAGLNVTFGGAMASGEWIDVIIGRDWLNSIIQVRMFAQKASVDKIPYTDGGVTSLVATLMGAGADAVTAGVLAADSFVVTQPKVASIDPAVRGTRVLPNIPWTARLAGAIHAANINGVVTN